MSGTDDQKFAQRASNRSWQRPGQWGGMGNFSQPQPGSAPTNTPPQAAAWATGGNFRDALRGGGLSRFAGQRGQWGGRSNLSQPDPGAQGGFGIHNAPTAQRSRRGFGGGPGENANTGNTTAFSDMTPEQMAQHAGWNEQVASVLGSPAGRLGGLVTPGLPGLALGVTGWAAGRSPQDEASYLEAQEPDKAEDFWDAYVSQDPLSGLLEDEDPADWGEAEPDFDYEPDEDAWDDEEEDGYSTDDGGSGSDDDADGSDGYFHGGLIGGTKSGPLRGKKVDVDAHIGEYIFKRKAVDGYGKDLLDALNTATEKEIKAVKKALRGVV